MRIDKRKIIALVSGVAVVVAGVTVANIAYAATSCQVTYNAQPWNEGPGTGGFTANITVNNTGDPWTSWTLRFTLPSGQSLTQGWSANWSASGTAVTATSLGYNGNLGTGASTGIGFNGRWSGTYSSPTSFSVNNVNCGGTPPSSPPPSSPRPPSSPPPSSPPPSSPPPSSPPPGGARVDNPYAGAGVYNNPEWRAKAAAEPGGSRISNQPTGVWMDRIAAINGVNGGMGLIAHLDEAVRQDAANGSAPLVAQFVIYNLPGRDCAALASNGELGVNDLPRYQAEYIDPIAAIMGRAAYRNLRIVAIIEIDSLPNLVTNLNIAKCATMNSNGGYVNGVGYALNKLGDIPNVYNYIDSAHHGWIGWDSNFNPTADKLLQAARANGATVNDVHGFITNTANYSALQEPYITVDNNTRPSRWIDWNFYNDEQSFAAAFRNRLAGIGFPSNIGMLIDTSRNGWGNCVRTPCQALPNRPTGPSNAADLNTRIDQSRIDRRIHKGNWCNQTGAGLGERPRANPAAGIDAYVWIKPPGESDGASREIPNDEGKGFDRMCDPTYGGNGLNGNNPSGALPDAPLSGHWFSAQFQQLMANAFPAL